jgi:hypothetical protein
VYPQYTRVVLERVLAFKDSVSLPKLFCKLAGSLASIVRYIFTTDAALWNTLVTLRSVMMAYAGVAIRAARILHIVVLCCSRRGEDTNAKGGEVTIEAIPKDSALKFGR